jgi:cyclic beta-1,2-glucan synthetase
MSLRRTVRLEPGAAARVLFTTAVADTRDEAVALAEKYSDPAAALRALELAWTNAHVELRYLGVSTEEAHLFLRLASRLLYVNPDLRARPEVIARNTRGQSGLWAFGVSGDLPVVVVRVSDAEQIELVRQLLRAHEFWRLRGLSADLVILNEHPSSYRQELQDLLLATVRSSPSGGLLDKPGGVFVRRTDLMSDEDRILFLTVARAVLVGGRGSLAQQSERQPRELRLPGLLEPARAPRPHPRPPIPRPQLEFFNGLGGFARGGREYVTVLGEGQWTPAPWSNVVANERLGFIVTESGGGYTWCDNSRENRLTPWSNDAVSDPPGEAVYVRDEETGEYWTPTPLPVRGPEPYVVRHGQGYTVFEHTSHGIEHELTLFVAPEDPVKLVRLRLRNATQARRRLTATFYAEWVLGVLPEQSAPYVVTEVDEATGALFARNPYNNEFAHKVAFADATPRPASFTAERKEFVGRNGTLARPRALERVGLSGRAGAGYDPCAALQVAVELAAGERREVTFRIGEGDDVTHARSLVERYREPGAVASAIEATLDLWEGLLGRVQVETPDKALDAIVNRWLLYQTLCCRAWGRAAFYQSGGAYGFRDQLQDVSALLHARPEAARAQILRAASRQFVEGDVQHWWHPPTGRGVRTRFSDDLLWLPYVAARYVAETGDASVLDERVPFVEARPLGPGEEDAYLVPEVSDESATVYEHCLRAIDRSLRTGAHGLPLMGAGDWNDGMNRVGMGGKGESVWLAWFLVRVLKDFAPIVEARGDAARRGLYLEHAERLRVAAEHEAWDGEWYVRAFFDDGTPLGSSMSEECRIDSIAQSWSVISEAGDPHRRIRAMAAVEQHLVRRGDGLIMLFTPPFDKTPLDPGYIKGYVPGVRENGGQYTHAAVWVVMAYAMLGDGDRAGELFALLNPVNHTATRAGVHRYKVEPYVAAADVYAVPPHTGRGGWTWYTGSAGWMYRVAVESILGFSTRGGRLFVDPCIPRSWPGFALAYRHGAARYRVSVENPSGVCRGVASVELDGRPVEGDGVPLADDGREHEVRVVLGAPKRMM